MDGIWSKSQGKTCGIKPEVTDDLHGIWAVIHLCRNRGKSGPQPCEYSLSYSPNLLWLKRKAGLPWWRSGWESACQCRGHGFEPWSGKIPHAADQLGPWATIAEPACLEPVLLNKRGRDGERPAHCDEEWPPLAATRESPRAETKTQHSQKINTLIN